jgi:hypothetical protein
MIQPTRYECDAQVSPKSELPTDQLDRNIVLREACVIRFLRGSAADTTGSRRTLLTKSISHGRSQFKVHTDERTQVHSAQPSLAVTHPSTNRDRRNLTSMNKSPS